MDKKKNQGSANVSVEHLMAIQPFEDISIWIKVVDSRQTVP